MKRKPLRSGSRGGPPCRTAHPACQKPVPAQPHLSSSPASEIVGKWKPLPNYKAIRRKVTPIPICGLFFSLKLFLCIPLFSGKGKKSRKPAELQILAIAGGIEYSRQHAAHATDTDSTASSVRSRLCMHLFSY